MGKPRNAGREIAFSLLFACVFGTAFTAYLLHTMRQATSPTPANAAQTQPALTPAPPELQRARDVVEAFASALSQKQYENAYALMAEPYRTSTPLAAFEQTCTRSPLLSSVQKAAVFSTRRSMLYGAPQGPYSEQARGLLVGASGSIDAIFTLLVSGSDARILVLALAGVPVLDGVSGAVTAPRPARDTARTR